MNIDIFSVSVSLTITIFSPVQRFTRTVLCCVWKTTFSECILPLSATVTRRPQSSTFGTKKRGAGSRVRVSRFRPFPMAPIMYQPQLLTYFVDDVTLTEILGKGTCSTELYKKIYIRNDVSYSKKWMILILVPTGRKNAENALRTEC